MHAAHTGLGRRLSLLERSICCAPPHLARADAQYISPSENTIANLLKHLRVLSLKCTHAKW